MAGSLQAVPKLTISNWRLRCFHVIAQRRVAGAFRALRVAHAERVPDTATPNLIVMLNHPSWWDPLVGFVLSRRLFHGRRFFAPMDAVALARYGIFRRLGLFPVALDSPRGAAQFLRAAAAVLDAGDMLGVTPQGQFTDVRVRPVQFKPGLAALLQHQVARGRVLTVVPLALEYTFWDQRLPEALVNCGEPLQFGGAQDTAAIAHRATTMQAAIQRRLEQAMSTAQEELAALSLQRDPHRFTTMLHGRRGSSGFYGIVEAIRGMVGGNPQHGDHEGAARLRQTQEPAPKA